MKLLTERYESDLLGALATTVDFTGTLPGGVMRKGREVRIAPHQNIRLAENVCRPVARTHSPVRP